MKTLNFITRMAICLFVVIALEGVLTFGKAFEFENYNIIGCAVQMIFLIVCVRISVSQWSNESPNHI
jgi:hypothetical protein